MRSRSALGGDRAKLLGVMLALAAVAGVHALVPVGTHPLHVIHVVLGALYFVPIAAAAIWFGTRGGLAASSGAAALYLLHAVRAWSGQPMENTNQVATAALFVWFGAVTGTLSRLREAERAKRLAAERAAQRAGSIQAIASLAEALGFRDEGTRDHSERVANLAVRIASRLGWEGEPLEALRLAALVHDVGKIGVRDDVLLKPGTLGPEERARIERHPEIAADILRPVAGTGEIARIVLAHHEAPDGSGYPRGLAGEDVPEGARILRVADVYCALRESRAYKAPLAPDDRFASWRRSRAPSSTRAPSRSCARSPRSRRPGVRDDHPHEDLVSVARWQRSPKLAARARTPRRPPGSRCAPALREAEGAHRRRKSSGWIP